MCVNAYDFKAITIQIYTYKVIYIFRPLVRFIVFYVNIWFAFFLAVCTCNTQGTVDNQGCNKETGECTCKRYVTGRDCNQCIPGYWGLTDSQDGCKPCDCDVGGAYDNMCDVHTGQCR